MIPYIFIDNSKADLRPKHKSRVIVMVFQLYVDFAVSFLYFFSPNI
jgi:hypothetical protein